MPAENDIIDGIKRTGNLMLPLPPKLRQNSSYKRRYPMPPSCLPQSRGQPYPASPKGVKAWFQVHPTDATPGSGIPNLPHIKYVDWTGGKRGKGGSWGHIVFPF